MQMNKTYINTPIKIWIGISKNNKIQIFSKIPKRGKECWLGDFYVNSIIYNSIKDMIKNSTLSWRDEPEYLELSYQKVD